MTWTSARLKNVCVDAGQYGLNVSANDYAASGYRLIRITDIDEAGSLRSRDNAVFVDIQLEGRYQLEVGDLLLARSGATIGRSTLVGELEEPSTFAGYLVRFRPLMTTDPRFLAYVAASHEFQDAIKSDAVTSTIQNFNAERYANISIVVPPLDEQRRIADFLDAETARIDALLDARRSQLELFVQRRFALTRHVLQNGASGTSLQETGIAWLPRCPAGWKLKKLGYVTQCLDGARIPLSAEERATRQGEFPYYGASTIVDYVDDYLFDEELVLLGEDGAQLGNPNYEISSVVRGRIWVNNHAHVLRTRGISAPLLAAILNVFDRELCMSGSTREKITQEAMNALIIPVPPAVEQSTIERMLTERRTAQDRVVRAIQQQIEILAERRQALITAAVTGEITV